MSKENVFKVYKLWAHNHANDFTAYEDAFYNAKGYNETKAVETAVTSAMADFLLYQKEIQKKINRVLDDYPELGPLLDELEFCIKYSEKFEYLHKYIKNDLEMHEVFDNKGGRKIW